MSDVDEPRSPARPLGIVALLLIVLMFDVVGFGWGLPHTEAPHPDDTAKPALEALQARFLGGSKYPKVHLLTLNLAYAPYLVTLVLTGDLDLAAIGGSGPNRGAFKDPLGSTNRLLVIARGVSVLMHLGSVAFLYLAMRRLLAVRSRLRPPDPSAPAEPAGNGGALLAAFLYGLAPMVSFFARTSRVDVPMMFWFAAAFWAAVRSLDAKGPTLGRLLTYGLIATLAVCTKEQIAFALIPISLGVALSALSRRRNGWLFAIRDLAVTGGASLFLFALLNDLLWAPDVYFARLDAWSLDLGSYRRDIAGDPSGARIALLSLASFPGVGGLGLTIVGLAAAARAIVTRDRVGVTLLALALLYPLLAFGWLGFMQPRYLFPVVFLFAALVGQQWGVISAQRVSPFQVGLLTSVLGLTLIQLGSIDRELLRHPMNGASSYLDAEMPDGTEVEVYQNENLLPGLRAIGLVSRRESAMDRASFAIRRPEIVVIADNSRWSWGEPQRRFADWLMGDEELPAGYERVRFGPVANGGASQFVPQGPNDQICPNVVIVRRIR